MFLLLLFFFKQKTAYEMRISDWSSDVCSSDLLGLARHVVLGEAGVIGRDFHRAVMAEALQPGGTGAGRGIDLAAVFGLQHLAVFLHQILCHAAAELLRNCIGLLGKIGRIGGLDAADRQSVVEGNWVSGRLSPGWSSQ